MTRFLTAAVGIPIVAGITLWGSVALFTLLVAVVAAISFDEFISVTGSGVPRWLFWSPAGVAASFSLGAEAALASLAVSLVVIMTVLLRGPVSDAGLRMTCAAAGLVYTGMLPGMLLLVPREDVLILLGVVWAVDIGAYYGGRTLGRRPLAPRVSPKKTVEGAVIGLASGVAVGLAVMFWIKQEGGALAGMSFAAVGAAAQVGDLVESAVKRTAGVKDSSSLLPGHGGMLDRIDGLLFATPVFYLLCCL
jgi:phosphatidate cytidylyltransferase